MATVIKCIVSDKKVVDVLRLLKDFCLDPPVVEPMDDAGAPSKGSGAPCKKLIFDFVGEEAKRGTKIVTSAQLSKVCTENGGHANGYSYALKRLLETKKLKRGKQPHTYEVLK